MPAQRIDPKMSSWEPVPKRRQRSQRVSKSPEEDRDAGYRVRGIGALARFAFLRSRVVSEDSNAREHCQLRAV